MIGEKFQIIKSSADVFKDFENKELASQFLFGESFIVLKKAKNFVYGYNLTDKYKGWVNLSDLGNLPEPNYHVSEIRTNLLSKPNVKSKFIKYLPIGSKIKVINLNKGWAKIHLDISEGFMYGYVPENHIRKKLAYHKDWVVFSEKFIGVPYRWGGRDSIGIDCSSLIQVSIAFSGFIIPRDTIDQIVYFNKSVFFYVEEYIKKKIKVDRGSIIFWEGHIAVAINKHEIIHATGFHNKVACELLDDVVSRINKPLKVISLIKN